MSDNENAKRGRPPRERHASNMIEQRPPGERRKSSAALDEARLRQQAIGVRLRQMFDQVVNEDVPDEFLDILRKADSRASEKG
ncbi:NepR family anti-sigma factor [Phenylobacterium sp.]|uniref:anti-sigma T factor NepR n=1 Tax=Phenylobacterium sp. TaxID=1871053 RepID=UPI0039C93D9E